MHSSFQNILRSRVASYLPVRLCRDPCPADRVKAFTRRQRCSSVKSPQQPTTRRCARQVRTYLVETHSHDKYKDLTSGEPPTAHNSPLCTTRLGKINPCGRQVGPATHVPLTASRRSHEDKSDVPSKPPTSHSSPLYTPSSIDVSRQTDQ